ncbi:hypothetical protein Bbelb_254640 [Branchiostoma belcheri]|nr:hypothetical protein Bbelb_254640 [Branchiostoma belcheri]
MKRTNLENTSGQCTALSGVDGTLTRQSQTRRDGLLSTISGHQQTVRPPGRGVMAARLFTAAIICGLMFTTGHVTKVSERSVCVSHHETAGESAWVHGASVDTTRLDSVRACGRHCATHHDRQRITNLAGHARLAIRVMLRRISIDVRDCCHKIAGKRITNLRDTPDLKTE